MMRPELIKSSPRRLFAHVYDSLPPVGLIHIAYFWRASAWKQKETESYL